MSIKLIGWIVAGTGGIALLWAAIATVGGFVDRARDGKRYAACEAAAKLPAGELDTCSPTVRGLVEEGRRSRACTAALATLRSANPDTFAIRMTCPEDVKRLSARADAAEADLADANAQLAGAQQRQDTAVARAEARADSTAKRKAADDAVIAAQPRTPDGRVTCDAQCLRRLASPPSDQP